MSNKMKEDLGAIFYFHFIVLDLRCFLDIALFIFDNFFFRHFSFQTNFLEFFSTNVLVFSLKKKEDAWIIYL